MNILEMRKKNREAGVLRGREVVEEMKEKLLATFLPQSLQPRLLSLTPSSSASSFEN